MFRDIADVALQVVTSTFDDDEVYYKPKGSSLEPVRITAPFAEKTIVADPSSGVPVLSDQPSVFVRLAELPSEPSVKDTIIVNGRKYFVHEVMKDAHGGATILLHVRDLA